MKYFRRLLVILVGIFLSGWLRRGRMLKEVHADHSIHKHEKASNPRDVSKKGWKAALSDSWQAVKEKELSLASAGLAYYATLTFFPAALGIATAYVLIAGSDRLLSSLDSLSLIVPPTIESLLRTQLTPLAAAEQASLGVAAAISLAAVLWTTSGGISNLIKAVNVAYDVDETRGFIKLRLLSILLSIVFIILAAFILVLLLIQADVFQEFGAPTWINVLFPYLRWLLLLVIISAVLTFVYRYAPNRRRPSWPWVSWGAAAATVLWLVVTALFFFYIQNFGNFNDTYGTFASIIILMLWFYLTSFIIVLGAQVNNDLEQQGTQR